MEVERKFDVDDETPLPDWESVPGVASVGDPEVRELDARYFDTADRALARAGYALRRRSGGPDEGWHIKGPLQDGGRVELHWPLDARSRGGRRARCDPGSAVDDDGAAGAQLLGDADALGHSPASATRAPPTRSVQPTAASSRSSSTTGWMRPTSAPGWSGPGASGRSSSAAAAPADHEALFAAVEAAVHAVGGREAASASKLARALGA